MRYILYGDFGMDSVLEAAIKDLVDLDLDPFRHVLDDTRERNRLKSSLMITTMTYIDLILVFHRGRVTTANDLQPSLPLNHFISLLHYLVTSKA